MTVWNIISKIKEMLGQGYVCKEAKTNNLDIVVGKVTDVVMVDNKANTGKCLNCGGVAKRGRYCMAGPCRRAYLRDWYKYRTIPIKSTCVKCGAYIKKGAKYCMAKECQREYIRNYMMTRYRSDPKFRKTVISNSVKTAQKKRLMCQNER